MGSGCTAKPHLLGQAGAGLPANYTAFAGWHWGLAVEPVHAALLQGLESLQGL